MEKVFDKDNDRVKVDVEKAVDVDIGDLKKIGGTTQTGDNWTNRFRALNDVSVTGLIKTLGDIGDDESLMTRLGERDDAAQDDHTETASLFAFLKGVLEKLGGTLDTQLTGSKAEEESGQHTENAAAVVSYNRHASATEIGVYVEGGSVRVRTDGTAATATTGVPLGEGFYEFFVVAAISVYFVANSTITVVSR